ALRSIANAIEDCDAVQSLDDEIDRTMLIGTVRADVIRLGELTNGDTADPAGPLGHVAAALDALMGENFDATREAALRARIAELPDVRGALRDEHRPSPRFLIVLAIRTATDMAELLDAAAER